MKVNSCASAWYSDRNSVLLALYETASCHIRFRFIPSFCIAEPPLTSINILRSQPSCWLVSNPALSAELLYMKLSCADPRNLVQTLEVFSLDLPPAGHTWNETCNSRYYVNLNLGHYCSVLLQVYLL